MSKPTVFPINNSNEDSIKSPAPRKAERIQVVGVGGGGCAIVRRLVSSGLSGISFRAVNTDAQSLDDLSDRFGVETFVLGEDNHQGAGGDPKVARDLAGQCQAEIGELMRGIELVFIIATLGGGTGTGAAPVISRIAKQAGALTIGLVTLSRKLELRDEQSSQGLANMRQECDAVMLMPNDNAFPKNENITWRAAYNRINTRVTDSIRVVSDMLTQTGEPNRDMRDLQTCLLSDTNCSDLYIRSAIAGGEDRIDEIVRELTDTSLHQIDEEAVTTDRILIFTSNEESGLLDQEFSILSAKLKPENYEPRFGDYIGFYYDDEMPDGELRVSLIMPQKRVAGATVLDDKTEQNTASFTVVDSSTGISENTNSNYQTEAGVELENSESDWASELDDIINSEIVQVVEPVEPVPPPS